MSVHRVPRADGSASWQVRWRDGGRGSRSRKRTFDRKGDAVAFEDELRRRRRLGDLAGFAGAQESLNTFVTETWAKTHAVTLAPKTAKHYASLYDLHIEPYLGELKLSELTPEVIARWQGERVAAGAGREAIRQAMKLLGNMLQRAMEGGRLGRNPTRVVRKIAPPRRREVRPLAPATVEALRAAASARDATLIAVLAYAGLRPQEALALRWGDIRERTILVERAVSLGQEKDTKTYAHRTVRLLAPLREDLLAWRMLSGRPRDDALLFPGPEGRLWGKTTYDNWRKRAFDRACAAANVRGATPYALRHSLRVAAPARGPLGGLRGAPARARRTADARHVWARDRRARRRAAAGCGGRDLGRSTGLVCPWCAPGGRAVPEAASSAARRSAGLCRDSVDGRSRTRTGDLLLVRQALSPTELTARERRDRRRVSAGIMRGMDGSIVWRAALIGALSLTAAAVALGAALPPSFFEDYGWIAGPAVWAACALLVAVALRLKPPAVLAGAALAGLPSLAGVLAGVHWVGAPLGIALLALWCGRLAARRERPTAAAAG